MSEAKRRIAAFNLDLKRLLLRELALMSAAPADGEVETYLEVQSLPTVLVPRQRREIIEWMRMQPNECHANAYAFTQLDPNKRSRMVIGWQCGSTIPRLHSVVDQFGDGNLVCVTPGPFEVLSFRVDPDIEIRLDGKHTRRGRLAPTLLRADPWATIEAAKAAKALIDAGVEVLKIPQEILDKFGVPISK